MVLAAIFAPGSAWFGRGISLLWFVGLQFSESYIKKLQTDLGFSLLNFCPNGLIFTNHWFIIRQIVWSLKKDRKMIYLKIEDFFLNNCVSFYNPINWLYIAQGTLSGASVGEQSRLLFAHRWFTDDNKLLTMAASIGCQAATLTGVGQSAGLVVNCTRPNIWWFQDIWGFSIM